MRVLNALFAITALLPGSFAALPTKAEGFAAGVTGGKGGQVVYPKTNAELTQYLGDNAPRIVYLDHTFDFKGTEKTATETGCAPWGFGAQCQTALNKNNWCTDLNPNAPKVSITYDKAALNPILVKSNKSIIGVGAKGIMRGKGLRLANGVTNVIIQNIHITDLNPHTVWGGDAITLDGTDNIWIDHCTTSKIGRQHIVLGNGASGRVSITNNKIDGQSSWSASCNTYQYWGIYFAGKNDLVTFKGNYLYHVSGRAPKINGNTLLHAVNNYWYDVSDHAFEIDNGAMVLAEGNVFQNVKNPVKAPFTGRLFTVPNAAAASSCSASLGRACQLNTFGSSGAFSSSDTSFLGNFKGKTIASAGSAESAKSAQTKAGFGVA
ncbi:pectin lyase fold/virulence factor [Ilyonectria destructans]|nr:pectin lyase fold/virulence factor [Ilyonectria destructans]